ncbi:MAG: hypothetical protein QW728_07895 [Thermoplasmata archaeon]
MKYARKNDEKGISWVVGAILLGALLIALTAILVVYLTDDNRTSPGNAGDTNDDNPPPPSDTDKIKKIITKDVNNWLIRITAVNGTYNLDEIDVSVRTQSDIIIYRQTAPITTNATGRVVIANNTGIPNWYCVGTGWPDNPKAGADYLSGATPIHTRISTITNAQFVIIDNDCDGKVSADDIFYIYADYNGDNYSDVKEGYQLQIVKNGFLLCQAVLN